MPTRQAARRLEKGAILAPDELRDRLLSRDWFRRIVITPLLSPRVQGGTVDVRLGTKFVTGRRSRRTSLDPIHVQAVEARSLQERHEIGFWESFVAHPQQLILACTLEYIALPLDLAASVINRSTYARSGLIAATAIHVHPGYKGCLTLELLNLGDVPIRLRPGLRIAQLVFHHHATVLEEVSVKYAFATAPEFPRLWEDEPDRSILAQLGERRTPM